MEKIVFESEKYGTNASGRIIPFQIIVKESFANGFRMVETIRREFKLIKDEIISEDRILVSSMWKEE